MLINLWLESLKERRTWRNPGVDGRVIIKWVFGVEDRRMWIVSCVSGYTLLQGCCGHGGEPSGSIKGGEFLDQVIVLDFSEKGCAS
jgi:hypothetical protein